MGRGAPAHGGTRCDMSTKLLLESSSVEDAYGRLRELKLKKVGLRGVARRLWRRRRRRLAGECACAAAGGDARGGARQRTVLP